MTKTVPLTQPIRLFDGYVENASLSVSYGANGSTCQVTLVYEDDGPLNQVNILNNLPALGTAVGFVAGEMSFGGVLQRYVEQKALTGYKWDLVIEAPGKVLDGVQVILDQFQGTGYSGRYPFDPSTYENTFTNQMNNVWNPFAIKENYNYGGIFGGADVNSSGFPVLTLLDLLEEISQGLHDFGGPIYFGESTYTLDLSDLKTVLNGIQNIDLLRVKGPINSLAGILNEITEYIMHDYIVMVRSRSSNLTNGIITDPEIYIKLIDKSVPSNPNVIRNAVKTYEAQGQLISASAGKELQNTVTQRMIIGGPATRYYVAGSAIQLWGKTKGSNRYTTQIILENGQLYTPDLLEIRCAMASQETWILYNLIKKYMGQLNPSLAGYANTLFSYIRVDNYTINKITNGTITVNDLIDTTSNTMINKRKVYEGIDPKEQLTKIHNSIKSAGDEYYGRKFLVQLPYEPGGTANNLKFVKEDQKYVSSWDITDSAWTEGYGFSDISFYDRSGKLKPTVVFPYDPINGDYSGLGSNYAMGFGGIGTVIDVEKDIYWLNIYGELYPYAVVSCNPVDYYDTLTTDKNGLWKLLNYLLGVPLAKLARIAGFGSEEGPMNYAIAPDRAIPFFYGVPQQSNRYSWGPWWRWTSKTGRAEVNIDTDLTPETYGGFNNMLQVGFVKSHLENSEVTGVESGYVEVTGLPNGNIGDRFIGSGPYVTNIDIDLSIGGVKTTYKFNTWTPQFGKLQEYNLNRIANIQKSTLEFLQDQRNRYTKQSFPAFKMTEGKFGGGKQLGGGNLQGLSGMGGLWGSLYDNDTVNINSQNIHNAVAPASQDYDNNYGATPEQIWSPVKIKKTLPNSASGPEFINPTTVNEGGYFEGGHVGPTSKDLNPYFTHDETDFQVSIKNSSNNDSLNLQENPENVTEVRSMGMRAPLILSGWGRTVIDTPTPAASDSSTEKNYATGVGKKRSIWKTGPLDIKWDEERGVWTSGFHLVEGKLTTDITAPTSFGSSTTFTITLKRGKDWKDGETITVTNRDPSLVANASDDIFVMAIRINYEWRPIWVGCAEE